MHRANPNPFSPLKLDYYRENSQKIGGTSLEVADTAVVVPAYNEEGLLARALASINLAASFGGIHTTGVVVVNNASTDYTREVAECFGVSVVDENFKGVGAARQTGLKLLPGNIKHVLTTDSDTVVPEDWISRMIGKLTSSQRSLIFSDVLFRFDTSPSMRIQLEYLLFKICGLPFKILRHKKDMPVGCGSNMAFYRDEALRIGGYDSSVNQGEDEDLRARMGGTYVPGVRVMTSMRRKEGTGFLKYGLYASSWIVRRYLAGIFGSNVSNDKRMNPNRVDFRLV